VAALLLRFLRQQISLLQLQQKPELSLHSSLIALHLLSSAQLLTTLLSSQLPAWPLQLSPLLQSSAVLQRQAKPFLYSWQLLTASQLPERSLFRRQTFHFQVTQPI